MKGTFFHGEWDLFSQGSAWILLRGDELICGSFDYEKECDPQLAILLGLTLEHIDQTSPFDVSFRFSSGLTIEVWGNSITDNYLEVTAPGDILLEFSCGKWNQKSSNEPNDGLSNEEQQFYAFSKKSHERWKRIVPQQQSSNSCYHCASFRDTNGRFYFGAYGLCSNGSSDYDGKVVSMESGCTCFSKILLS